MTHVTVTPETTDVIYIYKRLANCRQAAGELHNENISPLSACNRTLRYASALHYGYIWQKYMKLAYIQGVDLFESIVTGYSKTSNKGGIARHSVRNKTSGAYRCILALAEFATDSIMNDRNGREK